MKKLFIFLCFLCSLALSAQSTMTITSIQADPTPTFTSSATKVIVKLALNKAGQTIMSIASQNNFSLDIRVCFFESATVTPVLSRHS